MELRKLTVEGFINETASSSPAPGGGSIAALNASSSAALIAMVANLTLGKEKYAAVEGDMKDVAAKATALKDDFLALIDEDSNAFNKIMAAFKLPKDTRDPLFEKSLSDGHPFRRDEAMPKPLEGLEVVCVMALSRVGKLNDKPEET